MEPQPDVFVMLMTLVLNTIFSFVPFVLSICNKRGKGRIALWAIIPIAGFAFLTPGITFMISLVGIDLTATRKLTSPK